jgi:hypothetical protein
VIEIVYQDGTGATQTARSGAFILNMDVEAPAPQRGTMFKPEYDRERRQRIRDKAWRAQQPERKRKREETEEAEGTPYVTSNPEEADAPEEVEGFTPTRLAFEPVPQRPAVGSMGGSDERAAPFSGHPPTGAPRGEGPPVKRPRLGPAFGMGASPPGPDQTQVAITALRGAPNLGPIGKPGGEQSVSETATNPLSLPPMDWEVEEIESGWLGPRSGPALGAFAPEGGKEEAERRITFEAKEGGEGTSTQTVSGTATMPWSPTREDWEVEEIEEGQIGSWRGTMTGLAEPEWASSVEAVEGDEGKSSLTESESEGIPTSTTTVSSMMVQGRFRPVSRDYVPGRQQSSGLQGREAQQAFLANQIDLDESQGYTQDYGQAFDPNASITVTNFDGEEFTVAVIGVGTKYVPHDPNTGEVALPRADYHNRADQNVRRMPEPRVETTVSGPRARGPVRRRGGAPAERRRADRAGDAARTGLPWIQRRVSLVLEDARADVMSEEIAIVNSGERPPVTNSRVPPCGPGLNRRHRVGYDLIARGLVTLLKGKTVEQAADWLDYLPNWADQGHVAEDRKGLLDRDRTIRTLGAVEAMTTRWLFNAQNNMANFFCGDADINQRKGRAIRELRAAVKRTWGGQPRPLSEIDAIQSVDRVTENRAQISYSLPLEDDAGGSLNRSIEGTLLTKTLPEKRVAVLRAEHGAVLIIRRGDEVDVWGAALIFPGGADGQTPMIRRVSRSHKYEHRLDETTRLQQTEAAQVGLLANEIDVREPRDPTTMTYSEPYEPRLRDMPIVAAEDLAKYLGMIDEVNAELDAGYQNVLARWEGRDPSGGRRPKHQPQPPIRLDLPLLGRILRFPDAETAAKALSGRTEGDLYHQYRRTADATVRIVGRPAGIAAWALSQSEGKYRPPDPSGQLAPGAVVSVAYHQQADIRTVALRDQKSWTDQWRRDGRNMPPAAPLLTRTLDGEDLKALGLGIGDSGIAWVRKALHSKQQGLNLVTFLAKVRGAKARSLSNDEKAAVTTWIKTAVTDKTIEFPTDW